MKESTSPSDPFGLVGSILERKYRVDRVVAEGGFGVVYAGFHLDLDRAIAIKVLRPGDASNADRWGDEIAMFLKEARAIARMSHAAVVDVIDAGVASLATFPAAVPWMVLEWLEGETLATHLRARRGRGGRSPREALAFLRPALEAIAHAHDLGIFHRDLKPSNVMVLRSGTPSVKVLDFGIAKLKDDEPAPHPPTGHTATETEAPSFSAVCAAPEQLSGMRTGAWTDVYALALLLTEVLTDEAPYPDDATARFAVVFDEIRRPTPARLGVDIGAWEAVLSRALAVHPTDRPANARELLSELDRALDEPSAAKQAVVVPRGGRWAWVAAIGAATALAVVGAAGTRTPSAARATPVAAAACASNHECTVRAGRSALCRPSGCVALEGEGCSIVTDATALENEDTVWLGALLPQTGPDADVFGRIESHALDVARRDFEQVMNGVADQRPNDSARRIGLVLCDDAADPGRAVSHLVDGIGVPAILGFRSGVEHIDLASRILDAKGVLSVSTLSTNPLVTRLPQPDGSPRLVWRTTYNATGAAAAAATFIADLAAKEKLALPVRIALVHPKGAMGAAYDDAVVRAFRGIGGASADLGTSFRAIAYDQDHPDDPTQYPPLLEQLLLHRPHFVVFVGPRGPVEHLFVPLEARWPASEPRKPTYTSLSFVEQHWLAFAAESSRRRRIFGIWPSSAHDANTRFVARYGEVFPADGVTRTTAPSSTYDAFYLLAFASYAIPHDEPVTGAALARAIGRLVPPGRRVEVGISGIFEAYAELSAGRSIDLVGATGPLDFDLATGDAEVDQGIMCAAADGTRGIDSGLVYSAAEHRLVGKLGCP